MFPLLLFVLAFHPLVLSLLKCVADVLIVDDAQQSECFTTVLRTVIIIALLVADTIWWREVLKRISCVVCVVFSVYFLTEDWEKNVRVVVTTETPPNPSSFSAEERKKKKALLQAQTEEREREFFFSENTNRRYMFLRKYAKSMQKVCSAKALLCLTLSTYLVLQQLSLFQTKPKPLDPILQSVPKP